MNVNLQTATLRTLEEREGTLACAIHKSKVTARADVGSPARHPSPHLPQPKCLGHGGMLAADPEEFLSEARHTLQTPLTSIRAFAEILLANPDLGADERQRYLRIVVEESERLSRRIDDMLGIGGVRRED